MISRRKNILNMTPGGTSKLRYLAPIPLGAKLEVDLGRCQPQSISDKQV